MRKTILMIVLALGVLSSCIKADDIRVTEVEEIRLESMSTPVVTLRVVNDSRRNIEILSGKFTLTTSSGKLGEVMLTDVVKIPKKSETSITLPLRMKISNPLAAASILSGGSVDPDRLFVTGQARIAAGNARRDFNVEKMPVSRLMSIFDTAKTR